MKISKFEILNRLGIQSVRTKNITKQVGLSFLYKGGSILLNFMLVPLIIDYLDTTNYGIWLTITSFIGWFTFFDVGLGHGLRNKFAEAKAKDDDSLIKAYISSAYFTIGFVSVFLFVLFAIFNFFVDWTLIFNTNAGLKHQLSILMLVVFAFFNLQLVSKLITTIYTADQKPSVQGLINFVTQLITIILLWLLTKLAGTSLLIFGVIFSAIPVLVLLIFNIYSFTTIYKAYTPSLRLWKYKYINDIFGLGFKFFLIQMAGIILYSTDNMIITQLFGPKEVIPYNLAYKYFSLTSMLFLIIVAPYWSGITDAYSKEDFAWIKKSMKNLLKFTVLFCLISIGMIFFSQIFYHLWIGNKVEVPFLLSALMGLYFMFTLFVQPFTMFINGAGKIKIQLITSILMALINIPLAILFAKYIGLGTPGVILSTIVCSIPGMFYTPIQYLKIINRTAVGIWNK